MPEIKPTEVESTASIKVVGVGGAGGSAIDRMKEVGLSGVEFVAVNTDAQALYHSSADNKVQIGKGLGAGGDPENGCEAAEESRDLIGKALEGADMVFITLGAGGGTGQCAASGSVSHGGARSHGGVPGLPEDCGAVVPGKRHLQCRRGAVSLHGQDPHHHARRSSNCGHAGEYL